MVIIWKKACTLWVTVLVLGVVVILCYITELQQQQNAIAVAAQVQAQAEDFVMINEGETELPTLYITLTEADALTEKEYSDAEMTITYPKSMLPEQQAILDEILSLQIRYRGNSTYGYDKKPFKIRLDTEADLLRASSDATGVSAASNWILLADWVDRTHLHNYYMCVVARALDGIEYVPEGILVKVYFQGEYQGVYFLCEEIEADEARLNIADSGYFDNAVLMEATHTATQEYYFEVEYGERTVVYDIHSEIQTTQQALRAEQAVTDAIAAIATGDQETIAAAIDLDSCVDMYLLQEFMLNVDVGYSSFYIYIKENDDTIYFGPPWDFDRSLGTTYGVTQATGLYVAGEECTHLNEWYVALMQLDWFEALVAARWNEKKELFLGVYDIAVQQEEQYRTWLYEDYEMWHTGEEAEGETTVEAYQSQYVHMYYWVMSRYNWLDAYFNDLDEVADVLYYEWPYEWPD